MTTLSILLLGDVDRTEFRDSRACLDRWAAVDEFAETDAATAALASGEVVPDVIVVAQAFPGQFSHGAIDGLRQLAPLARILGLMGSWCEGELRSGLPWPATMRAYWHQWPVRCQREFHRLAEGQCSSWALPPTATEEERLLADVVPSPFGRGAQEIVPSPFGRGAGGEGSGNCGERLAASSGPALTLTLSQRERGPIIGRGLMVIRSPSLEMADWLSAACRRHGLATLWQRCAFCRSRGGRRRGDFRRLRPGRRRM